MTGLDNASLLPPFWASKVRPTLLFGPRLNKGRLVRFGSKSVCRRLSCSNLLCVNPRDEVHIQIGFDEIPQNHEWHVLN